MPCAVGVAIAILGFQPLGFALEVGEDRFAELWHVGGVDTVGPIRHRSAETQTIYFDKIMFWNADPAGHPDWSVSPPPG
jgi:hypothetical protein